MRRMQPAAIEPIVLALVGTTPSLDVAAARAELQDGWSRHVPIQRGIVFFERVRAMKYPDVAMGIRRCAADPTQQHTLRHDGEMRIHFENRQDGLRSRLQALRGGGPLELQPAEKGCKCNSRQRCAWKDVLSHGPNSSFTMLRCARERSCHCSLDHLVRQRIHLLRDF